MVSSCVAVRLGAAGVDISRLKSLDRKRELVVAECLRRALLRGESRAHVTRGPSSASCPLPLSLSPDLDLDHPRLPFLTPRMLPLLVSYATSYRAAPTSQTRVQDANLEEHKLPFYRLVARMRAG
ncbi:hypothetical protein RSOLAG22IIIB_11684 [Rhizoctonia solani]|uniref:Uncharacterized protein n=1 Tax=Rhizoctonia solani TaxID=456999 RepID=A0A0K6GAF2_9AGAM|nr:hypothetical protein RSOLAG22IIIB_11684 [Rhizoctonia solani]